MWGGTCDKPKHVCVGGYVHTDYIQNKTILMIFGHNFYFQLFKIKI